MYSGDDPKLASRDRLGGSHLLQRHEIFNPHATVQEGRRLLARLTGCHSAVTKTCQVAVEWKKRETALLMILFLRMAKM